MAMAPMRSLPQRPSGLNGAIPTTYDPNWQVYTDLSPAQIAAFQAFPQDLIKYAGERRWQKEIAGVTVNGIAVPTGATDIALIGGLALTAMRNPAGAFHFVDNGVAHAITADQALALFDAASAYVQACRTAEATLLAAINATPPTVTGRAQIDAAFAAISQG